MLITYEGNRASPPKSPKSPSAIELQPMQNESELEATKLVQTKSESEANDLVQTESDGPES